MDYLIYEIKYILFEEQEFFFGRTRVCSLKNITTLTVQTTYTPSELHNLLQISFATSWDTEKH